MNIQNINTITMHAHFPGGPVKQLSFMRRSSRLVNVRKLDSPIKVTIVLVVQLPMPCVLCPDPSQNINNQKLKLQCGQCLQKHKEKA